MQHNFRKNTGKRKLYTSTITQQNEVALIYQLISQLRSDMRANILQLRSEAHKEISKSISVIKSQTNEKLAKTEMKLFKVIVSVIGVGVMIPGFLAIWVGQ